MSKILDCIVTGEDANILKPFVGDRTSKEFRKYGLHTGIDLEGKSIFSISSGSVRRVTKTSVFVYDDECGFLYSNLSNVLVDEYQELDIGDDIGETDDYVHFEYMTKLGSQFPFRHGELTLFRQDPTDILENSYMRDAEFDQDDVYNDIMQIDNSEEPEYDSADDYYDTEDGDGFYVDIYKHYE